MTTPGVNAAIIPPTLLRITIAPATVTLPLYGSQQYTATGTYSDGTIQDVTSLATWTSGRPAVVSVMAGGLANVIGLNSNIARVRATVGSVTSKASVINIPLTLRSIAITPAQVSLSISGTQQYVARGTYNDGSTQIISTSVTWTSGNPSAVSVSSTGLAMVLAVSTAAVPIKASVGTITSNTSLVAVLTAITITPKTVSLAVNTTRQFSAVGTYNNGTTRNLNTSVHWVSSAPSVVSISTAGLATVLAASNTPVSVTATLGTLTSNVATITVQPLLTSITITPTSISVGLNAQQQYTAIGSYSNSTTKNITSSVTWVSANPLIVSISTTGLAKVLATSSTSIAITASSGSVTSNVAWVNALASLPIVCQSPTIDMKLLVVSQGQTEADLPAILQILNYAGTPYTLLDFSAQPAGITPTTLSDGSCHGYYQGVIFAIGGYIYTLPGVATLTSYEQTFGIRQLNWYTYPGTDFGFQPANGSVPSTSTYMGTYTAAGKAAFPYLNTNTPLQISNASVYLALPNTPPAGTIVTPMVLDSLGNALSLDYNFGDGREYLTQTFDSNPYLTHDLVLAYGLLNWVTKGAYLGEYHVYAEAQVDDFFINDSEWIPGTPCTDPVTHDRTPPDSSTLPTFRLNAADMTSIDNWQSNVQNDPLLSNFTLTLAFNGVGTTGNTDWTGLAAAGVANDDLTSGVQDYQQDFHWITHTYDHPGTLNGLHKSDALGDPSTPQVDSIDLEILTNQFVANGSGLNLDLDTSDVVQNIGLTDFNPANAVTPGVSGLNDPNAPVYLYQDGIRYVVSDTSVKNITNPPNNNGNNPSPNVGIVNSFEPGIYEVPRHPNDVFYNAANWNDDDAEFVCIYNNPAQPPFNTFTSAQILDFVSSSFVTNMLMGDMDPEMFHQPNLHDYDGLGHSLLSDTYDQTFSKYEALYKLPVLSLTLDQLGVQMQARNAYNLAGVTASLVGATGSRKIVLTMPSTSTVPSASIPVTGLISTGSETYGTVNISHITLTPGQSVTLPIR